MRIKRKMRNSNIIFAVIGFVLSIIWLSEVFSTGFSSDKDYTYTRLDKAGVITNILLIVISLMTVIPLFITCLIYSLIYWLVIMLFPNFMVNIFTTKEELIEFTTIVLRIYMACILVFGIQIACQQTFIALGNAPISLFLALLRKVFLLIPLIYILPLFIDNKGIFSFCSGFYVRFIPLSKSRHS